MNKLVMSSPRPNKAGEADDTPLGSISAKTPKALISATKGTMKNLRTIMTGGTLTNSRKNNGIGTGQSLSPQQELATDCNSSNSDNDPVVGIFGEQKMEENPNNGDKGPSPGSPTSVVCAVDGNLAAIGKDAYEEKGKSRPCSKEKKGNPRRSNRRQRPRRSRSSSDLFALIDRSDTVEIGPPNNEKLLRRPSGSPADIVDDHRDKSIAGKSVTGDTKKRYRRSKSTSRIGSTLSKNEQKTSSKNEQKDGSTPGRNKRRSTSRNALGELEKGSTLQKKNSKGGSDRVRRSSRNPNKLDGSRERQSAAEKGDKSSEDGTRRMTRSRSIQRRLGTGEKQCRKLSKVRNLGRDDNNLVVKTFKTMDSKSTRRPNAGGRRRPLSSSHLLDDFKKRGQETKMEKKKDTISRQNSTDTVETSKQSNKATTGNPSHERRRRTDKGQEATTDTKKSTSSSSRPFLPARSKSLRDLMTLERQANQAGNFGLQNAYAVATGRDSLANTTGSISSLTCSTRPYSQDDTSICSSYMARLKSTFPGGSKGGYGPTVSRWHTPSDNVPSVPDHDLTSVCPSSMYEVPVPADSEGRWRSFPLHSMSNANAIPTLPTKDAESICHSMDSFCTGVVSELTHETYVSDTTRKSEDRESFESSMETNSNAKLSADTLVTGSKVKSLSPLCDNDNAPKIPARRISSNSRDMEQDAAQTSQMLRDEGMVDVHLSCDSIAEETE